MHTKESIVVVWLKRDLRLHDNEAIENAFNSGKKIVFLYVFEPILLIDPHYSERHWNFIKQSLEDLNKTLSNYDTEVLCMEAEITSALNQIQSSYSIYAVYSHQETGIYITYQRDKDFKRYCRNNSIEWIENPNNGVERGRVDRSDWFEHWEDYMQQPLFTWAPKTAQLIPSKELQNIKNRCQLVDLNTPTSPHFQRGGRTFALKYAQSFFEDRHEHYMFHISKPALSRISCSRLSPYLAWGNLSVREVFQEGLRAKATKNKKQLGAFLSRIRWQAHFIQKFEMECSMEKESVNKGYHKLKKALSERYQIAWKEGQTGFPLIDAGMRCLATTGYINFRMRAMLVSFFTHILWQPWQDASEHLSRLFLDFEPGIHFPQLQMQAGETGINNLRIYNPTKNSLEHDAEAEFIKKWVPEIAQLPTPFIHEPSNLTPLEEELYQFKLGRDYPHPIVELKTQRKKAGDILWGMKDDPDVRKESFRILKKHTLSNRNRMLENE